jgi:hemolysin III
MPYKEDPRAPTTRLGELIANSITHGVGVGLSIAGLVVLIVRAARLGTTWYLVGVILFGATLVLQYTFSTLYHSMAAMPWKSVLQRLDHSAIFLLIAGTYTPFLFTHLRNWLGWTIFGLVWGLAVVMLVLKLSVKEGFAKPPVWLYLLLGWFGAMVFWQSWNDLPTRTLVFVILGGLVYSLGVVFYRWRDLPYSHSVWHLFVLGGSILHYFSILLMV